MRTNTRAAVTGPQGLRARLKRPWNYNFSISSIAAKTSCSWWDGHRFLWPVAEGLRRAKFHEKVGAWMSPGGLGSTGSRLKPAAARIGRPTLVAAQPVRIPDFSV